MSQEQLAEGLGVSGQQVRKYEAGRNRISASTLIAAARVLRVPPASLLPGDLPHNGDDETSLAKALGVSGAPELLLAFALIRDARRRAAIICIAEGLAAREPPRSDG